MPYGVPQGSKLGPLLFIIYINDVPNISENCTFIMYADDANILISGRNMAEIEEIFNFVAKKLEIWVSANGLSLNLKKTNYMIFLIPRYMKCLLSLEYVIIIWKENKVLDF